MSITLKERNQTLKEFFDRKTVGYDDVHNAFLDSKKALTAALPDGVSSVLDLGAGTGMELISLFERFPDISVTAADISEEMLSVLKKRPFADHVSFVIGDFFETDFGGNYDAMISTSALHHFSPEEKLVLYRKVYDALKPGGLFVSSDKMAPTPAQQEENFRMLAEDPHRFPHMDTPLTVAAECTVLEAVGFHIIEVTATSNQDYYLIKAQK